MGFKLERISVGPWPMNTYMILCEDTNSCAIIDPGAEPGKIIESVTELTVAMILLTHGHPDHIGALDDIRNETGAPVYIHQADANYYDLEYDYPLEDNGLIILGESALTSIHTPGHTPGSTCIDLNDGRLLVGDTIFVGGPGKTWTPEDFQIILKTMKSIVFQWPDETIFYPGHGPSGRIGDERPSYESFISRVADEDMFGDVTWD